ncbi:hypothetical protein PHYPO_G00074430 [Pangasianodon hypophthalmus]|uniref:Uncharacterized protein n=1 Tax=Pangasianodon hypophthalmus TaxID=310915 RepID=A0A5N5LUR4_PANHP|nr:hypothetical protein PHYPO_G00074430 [Pangasianodon hypophthalmus]
MATTHTICDDVFTAALSCVSATCEMLTNVFTCGGEKHDEGAVAEGSAVLEGVKLSVAETEPEGTQSSVRPFFSTQP